jgi:dipeptidase E
MKLLLTSAGLTTSKIREEFLHLVGKPASEITVAFIPTATDPEVDHSFVQRAINELKALGDITLKEFELRGVRSIDLVDLKDFSSEALRKKLSHYDVIWVNGGNTFYLLYWAKKSGFVEILPELLHAGKTYVGVSAGSILATPTIEVAGWKGLDDPNVVELENLRALNLVNFHIFPHYHTSYDARIAANRDKLSGDLTCLANNQAVVVDGKAIRLV